MSEFVIFANPCLEEAEENVKRFMCKLNEMSTKSYCNLEIATKKWKSVVG